MERKEKTDIVYVPTVLRSMAEIRETFGVGERQVKLWVEQGAPIAVEGEGTKKRYSTEAVRLQVWREGKGFDQCGISRASQ